MKKIITVLVILGSINFSISQTTWKNDPLHSKLTFTVTHQGFSSVFGLFQKFDISIVASKPDFSDAVFSLAADLASVNTEVKMRDEDLRSPNFFDVAKYPVMTFKSTSINNTTGMKDRFNIIGNLTFHGVTKIVILDLWFRGTYEDTISKRTKSGFQITGIINRSDFNVGPDDPFDISNDIMIKADAEFIKQ